LDPLGVSIAIANRNLGLDVAYIWFKTFQHLNVVPLVLEVNGKFTDLVTEVVAVLSELGNGEAMEDFTIVDSGDEAKGNGMDGVIEVLLGCQYCEGCLG
jgi:hypothetical protein